MVTTESSSAVVVRIDVPPAIRRLRRRWDRSAGMGVPAHVTLLFPFITADGLTPDVRQTLVTIAATVEAFEVVFASVDRFPTVVYLVPDPAAPFEALTEATVRAFPGYLPYGGAYDDVVPHLTVTETTGDDLPLDAISAEASRHLPFARRVTTVEVLVETSDGHWRPRWRIPLGVRP
jgi:2'-5' RNA ligase